MKPLTPCATASRYDRLGWVAESDRSGVTDPTIPVLNRRPFRRARLANHHGHSVLDLDQPSNREVANANPSFYIQGTAPVFVDEYQHVPMLLDAIKAELNRDAAPGRFVVTGSTRYTTIPRAAHGVRGLGFCAVNAATSADGFRN